jgi:hypothetical protein
MSNFNVNKYVKDLIHEFNVINSNGMFIDENFKSREFGDIPLIVNEQGLRSPKLENVDFVFTGCSQTFGVGLEEKFIWGKNIATKNNWTYNNLAAPGDSIFNIVFSLFKYFNQYGNPKHLACLFPDANRKRVYLDDIIYNVDEKINQFFNITSNPFDEFVPEKNRKKNIGSIKRNKYAKLPTHPENILSYPNSLYVNLTYIKILEQYCKSNNINFVWSTWSGGTTWSHLHTDESVFNEIFEFFSKIVLTGIENLDCHKENKDNPYFNIAYDNSHIGIHANLHIAENFMKVINDNTRN